MNEINMNYYKIVQNKAHYNHNFLYPLTVNLIMVITLVVLQVSLLQHYQQFHFHNGDLVSQHLHKFLQIY
jgi:hypothetical protein